MVIKRVQHKSGLMAIRSEHYWRKNETNLTFHERNVTNDNILDMFLSEHFIKLNPWHWTWYSVLYSYMASCLDTDKQWQFAGLLWEPLKEWVVSLMTTFCMIFPCRWAGKIKERGGTTKFRANHSNYLATSPWSMTTKESLWPLNSLKWFEKQRCWFRSSCQYPSLNSWTWFKRVLPGQVVLPFSTLEHLVKQQGPVREHSAICSTHIFLQPNCTCKGETETRWFQNKQALNGLWFMQ